MTCVPCFQTLWVSSNSILPWRKKAWNQVINQDEDENVELCNFYVHVTNHNLIHLLNPNKTISAKKYFMGYQKFIAAPCWTPLTSTSLSKFTLGPFFNNQFFTDFQKEAKFKAEIWISRKLSFWKFSPKGAWRFSAYELSWSVKKYRLWKYRLWKYRFDHFKSHRYKVL